jgi:hypothetical protein
MLSITAFAGTQRVSGLRLIRDLETMGAQIASSADREKVSTLFLSTQKFSCHSKINTPRSISSISTWPRTKIFRRFSVSHILSLVWLIKISIKVNDFISP